MRTSKYGKRGFSKELPGDREFIDHDAAEGISETQQTRQIQSMKCLLKNFAPEDFQLKGASETELKQLMTGLNRSEYTASTKHKTKGTVERQWRRY